MTTSNIFTIVVPFRQFQADFIQTIYAAPHYVLRINTMFLQNREKNKLAWSWSWIIDVGCIQNRGKVVLKKLKIAVSSFQKSCFQQFVVCFAERLSDQNTLAQSCSIRSNVQNCLFGILVLDGLVIIKEQGGCQRSQ